MDWKSYRKRPLVIQARGPVSQVEYIETWEGTMRADIGDFIICGISGEMYPCKPEIFMQTYEPVLGL